MKEVIVPAGFAVFCVVGLLSYAFAIDKYQRAMEQKKKLRKRAEDFEKNTSGKEESMENWNGIMVEYDTTGNVLREIHAPSLDNISLFSNPETASVFQKCIGRALRGGGYSTFQWPEHRTGEVKMHVAYSFVTSKKNTVMTFAEVKR